MKGQLNLFSFLEDTEKTVPSYGFKHSCYNCVNLNKKRKKITGVNRNLLHYGCTQCDYVPGAVPIGNDQRLKTMACGMWE